MINEILNKYVFEISNKEINKEKAYNKFKTAIITIFIFFILSNIALLLIFEKESIDSLRESSIIYVLPMGVFISVSIITSFLSTVFLLIATIETIKKSIILEMKNLDEKNIQFEYNNSNFSFPGVFSCIMYEDIFNDKLKKEEISFFINEFRANGYSDEKINKKITERLNYTKRFEVTLNDMAFIGLHLYENNESEGENIKNIVNNMLNNK